MADSVTDAKSITATICLTFSTINTFLECITSFFRRVWWLREEFVMVFFVFLSNHTGRSAWIFSSFLLLIKLKNVLLLEFHIQQDIPSHNGILCFSKNDFYLFYQKRRTSNIKIHFYTRGYIRGTSGPYWVSLSEKETSTYHFPSCLLRIFAFVQESKLLEHSAFIFMIIWRRKYFQVKLLSEKQNDEFVKNVMMEMNKLW